MDTEKARENRLRKRAQSRGFTIHRSRQQSVEVYIEQQIKEGLDEGKNPHLIGKEVSSWVGKLFETCISANSIRMRATRVAQKRSCTNVQPPPTTHNSPQNQDNQDPEPKHGGKREGAGAPLKYKKAPEPWMILRNS